MSICLESRWSSRDDHLDDPSSIIRRGLWGSNPRPSPWELGGLVDLPDMHCQPRGLAEVTAEQPPPRGYFTWSRGSRMLFMTSNGSNTPRDRWGRILGRGR